VFIFITCGAITGGAITCGAITCGAIIGSARSLIAPQSRSLGSPARDALFCYY
jgi:hypothetical protein